MKPTSRKTSAIIIIFIIGALILWIAYLVRIKSAPGENEFLSSALFNASFVFLSVVLLEGIWKLLGGDPISEILTGLQDSVARFEARMRESAKLLADSKETGIHRIICNSSDFATPSEWINRLKSANSQVDLMGYTLHKWIKADHFESEIIKLIRKGVKVRFLIMDKKNPHLNSLLSKISRTYADGELNEMQVITKNIYEETKEKQYRGSFELRTAKNGLIVCQIARIGDDMTVIPYLYSAKGPDKSPLLLICGSESPMFHKYQNEFDELWNLNSDTSSLVNKP